MTLKRNILGTSSYFGADSATKKTTGRVRVRVSSKKLYCQFSTNMFFLVAAKIKK
jgi:hypothetical protein